MKTRTLFGWLGVVAVLAAAGWWWQQRQAAGDAPRFRSAKVERGAVVASVAATGTLAATVQVQVSSQVSGQIREVLADFNSEVSKGQVIARLDPETHEYRVRQAEADVEAARAQVGVQLATLAARRSDLSRARINLEEARRDLDRKADLVARNFIAPAERDRAASVARALEQEVASAAAQVELVQAQINNVRAIVRQREAQLASSRVDLGRTVIRAPVDGIVIKRSIEPGQTVAASLSAPELFVIAQNLRDMQVEVSIDEAEVSRLQVGQQTTFTVDAFPGRRFEGAVTQVRKAAQNVQNVITYTAVVSARNESLSLVPGMTANVRIVTDTRSNVLKVPNAALRFRPPGFTDAPRAASLGRPAVASLDPDPIGARPIRAVADALLRSAHAQAPADGGGANPLRAFRERIERELALDEAQRTQLDGIFAAMRDRFAAVRDAPEAERARLAERHRVELRARINDILNDEQRRKYAEILADLSGRTVARGRVFVPGPDGRPVPVAVRIGLSDGAFTEVIAALDGGRLEEGDLVFVGTAPARSSPAPTAPTGRPVGPRL